MIDLRANTEKALTEWKVARSANKAVQKHVDDLEQALEAARTAENMATTAEIEARKALLGAMEEEYDAG